MKKAIFLSFIVFSLVSAKIYGQIDGASITPNTGLNVGTILTPAYTGSIGGSSTIQYQWFYSDNTNLGISATYKVKTADEGKAIYVKAQELNGGGNPVGSAIQSANTTTVNYMPVASSLSVTGTVNVGDILVGAYSYSDTEGDPESGTKFFWYRSAAGNFSDTVRIAGASSIYYKLTNSEYGNHVAFVVKPGSSAGSRTGLFTISSFTTTVTNSAPTASSPLISGTERVGEVLSASYSYSDAEGDLEGASKYQWYRSFSGTVSDTVSISGARSVFYKLTNTEYGQRMVFTVTPYAKTGNLAGTKVISGFTGAIANNPPIATNVAISYPGALNVNEVLTGKYTYIDAEGDPEQGSVYQWLRADVNDISSASQINSATSVSYRLEPADTGKYIFFTVRPYASAGNQAGSLVQAGSIPLLMLFLRGLPVQWSSEEQLKALIIMATVTRTYRILQLQYINGTGTEFLSAGLPAFLTLYLRMMRGRR
jgi:hypothetical protein